MGVTKKHLLREILVDEWRIRFWLFDQLVLIQRPFLRRRRAARQDEECGGESEQIAEYAVQFRLGLISISPVVMACTRSVTYTLCR